MHLYLRACLTPEQIGLNLGVSRRTAARYVSQALASLRNEIDLKPVPTNEQIERSRPGMIEGTNRREYLGVLATLTQPQRKTYRDYFLVGFNAREISEVEGLSRPAITRRITRIRRVFRKAGLPEPKHVAEGRRHEGDCVRTKLYSLSALASDTY